MAARDAKDVFNLQPALLQGTAQATVDIVPMTMDMFGKSAETKVDVNDLMDKMRAIMPDFGDDTPDNGSLALAWAHEIIYKVGPGSKGGQNKFWTFNLPEVENTAGNGRFKPIIHVTTQKGDRAGLVISNTHLTVKRAMMLAVTQHNVCATARLATHDGVYMLTPLASAAFAASSMPDVAMVMAGPTLGASKDAASDAMRAVNASTCNGGHNLADSRGPIAVAAAMAATNGKDPAIQKSIMTTIVRQYTNAGKLSANEDQAKVLALCALANGGLPSEYTHESLVDLWRNGRELSARQAAMVAAANAKAQVDHKAQLEAARKKQREEVEKARQEQRTPQKFPEPVRPVRVSSATNLVSDANQLIAQRQVGGEISWITDRAGPRFPNYQGRNNGLD